MKDKKSSDAMQVIKAMVDSITMEEAVNLISSIAHDRDIPILMCHMQDDSGKIKSPMKKANFKDQALQMRFTVFGFPKKVMDRTVEMLMGQGIEIVNYRVADAESPTESLESLDTLKKGKGPFSDGKPKGW